MKRAYSLLTLKRVDEDARVIEGIATTPTPDRVGDIVEPDGAEFKLPIPLLWQHMSFEPIGEVVAAKVTPDGIVIRAQIAKIDEPGKLQERLTEAWQSIKLGLVRGLSIGFRVIEESRIQETFSYRFIRWEWLELSAVTIPANAEASITAIKSIDRELRGASAHDATFVRLLPSGVSEATKTKSQQSPPGVSGVRSMAKEGHPEMTTQTWGEQIAALEKLRAAKTATMQEVMQKSIEEGRSTDASEREQFDELEVEVECIDGDLKRLRSLEKTVAVSAKPVGEVKNVTEGSNARSGTNGHSHVLPVRREEKLEPGIAFARFVACVAIGKGNLMQSMEIAKARYGENHEIVGLMKECVLRGTSVITKAPTQAGTTGNSEWAGALVDTYVRYAADFVEFLRPQTIIGKLGLNGIPGPTRVPFNVNIAGQNSGASGYWVGEGQPKPVTRAGFNSVNLGWAKVAAICVLSEELVRFSSPSADALMRDELARAVIERIDIDFVDPNKAEVTGVSPASITNGVTPVASTGNDADAIREDVRLLMQPYILANMARRNAVWIMSESTHLALSLMVNTLGQLEFPGLTPEGGRFLGNPVITSEYVTGDSNGHDVILVNAPDIWLADDGEVTVDASREASLQMADDPTVNSAIPTATTLVSLWQTNSIGLRAERYINWKKRRNQAVQMLSNVNWGEPGAS